MLTSWATLTDSPIWCRATISTLCSRRLSSSTFCSHGRLRWRSTVSSRQAGWSFTATHTMWPEHEMPWDFWRFPRMGFHALFNTHTGFEIVELAEGSPTKIYSLEGSEPTRRFPDFTVNAGVVCLARKIAPYREDLLKWDIATEFLGSMYPPGAAPQAGRLSRRCLRRARRSRAPSSQCRWSGFHGLA